MKKSILTLFVFAVLFSACKKEEEKEENTPLTKEELLCQTWHNDSYYLNDVAYAWISWQYVWEFKTDGTIAWYKIADGTLYKTTNWAWADDQMALDITIPDKEDQTARCIIEKLTETEMVLEPGDSDYQVAMSFSR